MTKVNTKDRLIQAGLKLFAVQGFQKTSIGQLESEAGLAPRTGAFYRHFESKQALLLEIAKTYVSETPEGFGLDRLADFGDTRAELVAIALKYEESMLRQEPFARLIEEIRLLDFGVNLQDEINVDMMVGLDTWIKAKPVAKSLDTFQRAALIITVIGGWVFYLSMRQRGATAGPSRDLVLDEWATRWALVLDSP